MAVQTIGKIIIAIGLLLILGAFGAADCETITLTRFFIALVCRVAFTIFGLCLAAYTEPDEHIEEIEVD